MLEKINSCFNLENLSKKINKQQFFVHFLVKSLTKTHEQKLVVLFFGEPQTWGDSSLDFLSLSS